MSASNTWDCFRECVGLKVVAVLRVDDRKLLVFDDGTGLWVNEHGAYGREDKPAVAKMVNIAREKIQRAYEELRDASAAEAAR